MWIVHTPGRGISISTAFCLTPYVKMSMSRSEGNTFLGPSLLNLPSALFAFFLQEEICLLFSIFRLFLAEDIFLEMEVVIFMHYLD